MAGNKSPSEQFAALLEGIKKEAYVQGFNDAKAMFADMLGDVQPPDISDVVKTERQEPTERKPAGHNRQVVLDVLSRVGRKGATQAGIIREAARRQETIAQSSVRHALHQLQKEGLAKPWGRKWRLVPQQGGTAGDSSQAGPAAPSTSNNGGYHAAA